MNQPGRGRWNAPPDTSVNRLGNLAEETRLRLGGQGSFQSDPPLRRDGCCANCRSSRPEVAVKNGDPFCSTGCARTWHSQSAGSPTTGP
jgi:hypothetical protein